MACTPKLAKERRPCEASPPGSLHCPADAHPRLTTASTRSSLAHYFRRQHRRPSTVPTNAQILIHHDSDQLGGVDDGISVKRSCSGRDPSLEVERENIILQDNIISVPVVTVATEDVIPVPLVTVAGDVITVPVVTFAGDYSGSSCEGDYNTSTSSSNSGSCSSSSNRFGWATADQRAVAAAEDRGVAEPLSVDVSLPDRTCGVLGPSSRRRLPWRIRRANTDPGHILDSAHCIRRQSQGKIRPKFSFTH